MASCWMNSGCLISLGLAGGGGGTKDASVWRENFKGNESEEDRRFWRHRITWKILVMILGTRGLGAEYVLDKLLS